MMREIKCCKITVLRWTSDIRYPFVMAALMVYMFQGVQGVGAFCEEVGCGIRPWFLPFILAEKWNLLVVMLTLLIIICDVPVRGQNQLLVCQRVGIMCWLKGQLLYVVFACAVFSLAVLISSLVPILPYIEMGSDWGIFFRTAALNREYAQVFMPLIFDMQIMDGLSPVFVIAWNCAALTLVGILFAQIIILCNLWSKKYVGLMISVFLTLEGYLITYFAEQWTFLFNYKVLLWASPVSWINVKYLGYPEYGLPSFTYAMTVLIAVNAFLCFLIIKTADKHCESCFIDY